VAAMHGRIRHSTSCLLTMLCGGAACSEASFCAAVSCCTRSYWLPCRAPHAMLDVLYTMQLHTHNRIAGGLSHTPKAIKSSIAAIME